MLYRRRDILQARSLLAGLAGVVAALAACKHKSQKSLPPPPEEGLMSSEDGLAKANPAKTSPEGGVKQESPVGLCEAGALNHIQLPKIAYAAERFTVAMKCYGTSTSCLLVVDFPKYQQRDLQEVYLAIDDGKLLAQRGINSDVDERPDGTLRPLIFDGLRVGPLLNKLVVVLYTSDDKFFQVRPKDELQFETSFAGKKAYGPSPQSLPSRDYGALQALPFFAPDVSSFYQQHADEHDFIIEAVGEISFGGSLALKDYIVTDLMGRVLAPYGDAFDRVVEHPHFICYRLVADRYYLRTIVRLT